MVRKKKQIKLKEPVRLREKKLKDGNRSLYLDIYSNGIRKYALAACSFNRACSARAACLRTASS